MAYKVKKFKDFRQGSDKEYYKSLRNFGYSDYEAKRIVAKRRK